ncbi:MAG TPA: hypothetical protein VHF06_15190 [Pseudonocardiaceae bacterium]|jgi:hypothetical protein|nr:hypothetical protein [Pseudonocardiaceae bacterium]
MADGDDFSVDRDDQGEWPTAFDRTRRAEGTLSEPTGSSFGYADYEALLGELVTGLGTLHDNLEKARTAVHEIANRYREADGRPPYPSR